MTVALPPDLRRLRDRIRAYALDYGLDFNETFFELLGHDALNEVAAYGGFPTRYPHWRFGMQYEQMRKSYAYGLQKIYELVINNDPCYAYLMRSNSLTDQKIVIAHVYGHADFFKNNLWFGPTHRKMIDQMANHGTRIRRYCDRFGAEKVERFLDDALTLENLIDPYEVYLPKTREKPGEKDAMDALEEEERHLDERVPRLKAGSDYMDRYVNPPEVLERERRKLEKALEQKRRFPASPRRDVLRFLQEHAPLSSWQKDVLGIVRAEALYFAPQAMTKVMNEGWACVAAGTPTFTGAGMIPMEAVVAGEAEVVSDGKRPRKIYGRNVIPDHPVLTVRTRRGLVLKGSRSHRVLLADGTTWRRLDRLRPGDAVAVAGGAGLWPREEVAISWTAPTRVGLEEVAEAAGDSLGTVMRHRAGRRVRRRGAVERSLEACETPANPELPQAIGKRAAVRIPERVDAPFAAFLGYLVGDGHISRVKRVLGLTTGDGEQAGAFTALARRLFGLECRTRKDGGRIRVLLQSETVADFLTDAMGLTSGPGARRKRVPPAILRSPEPVVRAFLRALFDCDGYAGSRGVILSTAGEAMGSEVQLLLLNFGILSRRRRQRDGCWQVHAMGTSAAAFGERVGFGLARKRRALEAYVRGHPWFKKEEWTDEVVALEEGREDVYDISVAGSHRYAAAGLVNHNSFWHSTILTERALEDDELIDFADAHSATLATSPGQLNPYKLGLELFRDIQDRWDRGRFGPEWSRCDDHAKRRAWDTRAGLGRQKIFEVRRAYNDVTFIDEFLTEDFVREKRMFVYKRGPDEEPVISTREFEQVKATLLRDLTNLGNPIIVVEDANHRNRGELLLRHRWDGLDLKLDYARDTLEALRRIWKRPCHVLTRIEDRPRVLSFDGDRHTSEEVREEEASGGRNGDGEAS